MQLNKLRVRKLVNKDIEQVISMGSKEKTFATNSGVFWTNSQLKKWMQSKNDVLLVAEVDSKIAGFALFATHLPTMKVTWENLYVEPSFRKSGIAKALLERGLDLLNEKGFSYIMLFANADNKDKFLTFLAKYGFKKGPTVLWIDKLIHNDK